MSRLFFQCALPHTLTFDLFCISVHCLNVLMKCVVSSRVFSGSQNTLAGSLSPFLMVLLVDLLFIHFLESAVNYFLSVADKET